MNDRSRVGRARAVFDEWAARGRSESMAASHEPFVRPVFESLPLTQGSWYLDIGCGNGYTVRWAAERVGKGKAIGIDVSPAMIQRARELSTTCPHATFHVAAFPEEHPLPHGRFSAIYSMEVFYYLPNLTRALEEVGRLLVPGGVFACQVDFYEENVASHTWPSDLAVEMTLLSELGWRAAFEAAGLAVADQRRVRLPAGRTTEGWKHTEGSLVTVGRRPQGT